MPPFLSGRIPATFVVVMAKGEDLLEGMPYHR